MARERKFGKNGKKIRLDKLPPLDNRSSEYYDELLAQQQKKLTEIQHLFLYRGERAVIVFEGMDAAGKGGTIRRIAWALDPRSLNVWPIAAPNEIEKQQHYLQRFWARMPEKGHFAVFDRSWYGRVLVERVEKFAQPAEWKRAYSEINEFERQLTDNGIRIVKLFLHVSKDEQLRRFQARLDDPLKRWKLSYEDFRNREKWNDYIAASEDMFDRTNTANAPWHVIQSDDKAAARCAAFDIIIKRLSQGLNLKESIIDPQVIELARSILSVGAVRSSMGKQVKTKKG
jgi:PPK2 family polyphosphate:nucleotide phosphotransferase